jgi:hypothetical protein
LEEFDFDFEVSDTYFESFEEAGLLASFDMDERKVMEKC